MLLPDSMELRICVPYNSRSTAWASFDGRGRVELKQGDHIKVTASKYPFPTVCADRQSTDWFQSISRTLKWNERERQKSFVVVEEGPARNAMKKTHAHDTRANLDSNDVIEEDDNEDEDDGSNEDEAFDIEFSSPTSSSGPKTDDNSPSAEEEARAMRKTAEETGWSSSSSTSAPAHLAAVALRKAGIADSRFSMTGVESPDRFGQPNPHPPAVSPRHMASNANTSGMINVDLGEPQMTTSPRSRSSPGHIHHGHHHQAADNGEEGDRDHIHNPKSTLAGAKSKIPRDRDFDAESMKTPRPAHAVARHPGEVSQNHEHRSGGHRRSLSHDVGGFGQRRAFAVWGHDESDPSDSDNN